MTSKEQISLCGVDEVGRGPWAGPVIAAAVILTPECTGFDLRDSKKMTKNQRTQSAADLKRHAVYGLGAASVQEIDRLNIRGATLLAMCRAIGALPIRPDYVEIDGRDIPPGIGIPARAIIGGDATHPHIAAASILAKVMRDRLMEKLAQHHPHYAWERNAGYGTKAHQEGLALWGVTQHHRRSFRPIHNILYEEK